MTKEEKRERSDAILDKQFEMAMNGSIEMLKWLGIQYCGQDNKPDPQESQQLPKGFEIRRYSDFEVEMFGSKLKDEFMEFMDARGNDEDVETFQELVKGLKTNPLAEEVMKRAENMKESNVK